MCFASSFCDVLRGIEFQQFLGDMGFYLRGLGRGNTKYFFAEDSSVSHNFLLLCGLGVRSPGFGPHLCHLCHTNSLALPCLAFPFPSTNFFAFPFLPWFSCPSARVPGTWDYGTTRHSKHGSADIPFRDEEAEPPRGRGPLQPEVNL